MLTAFVILLCATLIGLVLATLRVAQAPWWPHWTVPALHGSLGACGLVLAVYALSHSPDARGYGRLAAILLAGALFLGLLFLKRIRRRYPLLLTAHAGLAMTGVIILAAFRALG